MKICMLAPTGLPLASASHLLSEAQHLVKRGLDISLIVPNHYYLPFDTACCGDNEIIGGVKVKHVYLPGKWRGALRTHLFPLGYWTWKLVRRALEEPFDIIHVMKPYYTSGSAGLLLQLVTGKPMVLECDDLEGREGWGAGLAEEPLFGFKRRLIDTYERRLPHLADAVIADTLALRDMFRSRGVEENRLFYIPYSVEEYMMRTGDGERIRKELGIGDGPVAVYCGALHPHNYDCDLLIKAMKIVHGKKPDAIMMVVGDGGARPELEAMAKELGLLGREVKFAGWVEREEIPDYIAAADFGVVPMRNTRASRSRGLSKVLEYLCQAKPVVMAGIGQADELTDRGKAGVLTKPGDPGALAEGTVELLSNPSLAREKGNHGKRYVLDKFNPRKATDSVLEIYRSLAYKPS